VVRRIEEIKDNPKVLEFLAFQLNRKNSFLKEKGEMQGNT
jgi:hypothetical protein